MSTDRVALTPSQTVGPYFAIGLPWPGGPNAVAEATPDAVWIRGQVLDGAGEPIPDALIETWQVSPEHRAFARSPADAEGWFAVRTVKPAPVAGPGGTTQAPHLAVSVFARGLLDRVVTRIYFDDSPEENAADPVLTQVDPARRDTLIAKREEDGYRFDIRMQGEGETVFFAI